MSIQDGVIQMSGVKDEVIQANVAYAASSGEKARLAMPPARGFLILTCMDARLDPAKFAGLAEGDAHIVRNAGGRATDDCCATIWMRKAAATRVLKRRPVAEL